MSQSCVEIYVHVIFSTKSREPLITHEIEPRLYSYLCGIAKKTYNEILRINGVEDHVHMAIKLHQSTSLATLLKELKAHSTGWMKKNGFQEFGWQAGYGGFSYSKSMLDQLFRYIDTQKKHHQKYTLQEEFELFKKKWGVEWVTT